MYRVEKMNIVVGVPDFIENINDVLNRKVSVVVNTFGGWKENVRIIAVKVRSKNKELIMNIKEFVNSRKNEEFDEVILIGEGDSFIGEIMKISRV